ncbi:MAG: aspartate carbamoyltransferase regulatory subunit, partial [Prevotella sp.]|nr:aspartate carbamoyltransferase regulatory subunit [Prevotella sp.]
NNEPMKTHFHVIDAEQHTLRCRYCERIVSNEEVVLK